MSTHEIIPQSEANPAEQEFMQLVHILGRNLASNPLVADCLVQRVYAPLFFAISEEFVGVSLDGLRSAWLSTMGELCALHADAERNTVTQFHTLAREAESCIYYYAAGLVARTEAGNLNGDLSRSKFH